MSVAGPQSVEAKPPVRHQWAAASLAWWLLRLTRLSVLLTLNVGRRAWAFRHGAHAFRWTSHDGVPLDGLYLPASPGRPPRCAIIMAHGYIETKENHLGRAWAFAQAGHNVILFDQRGHGRSGGGWTTFGVRERHDVAALIDYAQAQGWAGDKVLTFGYSLGAATVLQHAAIDSRVARVVALAPFVNMREAVRSYRRLYAPFTDEAWVLAGFEEAARQAGFTVADAATLPAVQRLQVPVLIVVGGADRNLSAREHSRVLATANAQGICRLVEVPHANHFSIRQRHWPGLEEELLKFLDV